MQSDGQFKVITERHGQAVLLRPEGDVDMSRSAELRLKLRDALQSKPSKIIVDLQRVDYMDSSGLATLVEAARNARSQQTPMVLCALTQKVRAVFEIARLHQFFQIADSSTQVMDS